MPVGNEDAKDSQSVLGYLIHDSESFISRVNDHAFFGLVASQDITVG
jgi:hypothetical protein